MARRSKSILGDMSGKIGDVVLTKWKRVAVAKSLPSREYRKAPSAAQVEQRKLFAKVLSLLGKIGPDIFRAGYQFPKKATMSAINAAVSYHLRNDVIAADSDFPIEMRKLQLSRALRKTEGGYNARFVGGDGVDAVVEWDLNPYPEKGTQLNDPAFILFYDETWNRFIPILGECTRRELKYPFFPGKKSFTGHQIYCWLFFVSADGKLVSETQYLGMVKIGA